jgi:hypothetical protein
VDGVETEWTNPYGGLAKVRVAGSNPVFRSIVAGQGQFSTPDESHIETSLAFRCVDLASA